MGLFDLFKGKSKDSVAPAASGDKNVARFARAAGDKHAQNYDRMEALEALARIPTADSAAALLRRFTFHIDPSITDQEEKEVAFRGMLACGEEAIEPIRAFCTKAESLSWPLKVLKETLPPERYGEELVKLLDRFDTEYVRNVEPKVQLLSELEHTKSPAAREAAEKFLDDVNESIRFVAVNATFAQDDAASVEPLVRILPGEESMRVKNKIAEGIASRGWSVPEPLRDETSKALPREYALKGDGTIVRR